MVPPIQPPALIGGRHFFDFHNVFKTNNRDAVPSVPKQEWNGFSPKVPIINSVIPSSSFNFATIFTNQFDRRSVFMNPFDGTTTVIQKPTVPNVVKLPTPTILTTPIIKKIVPNPDSIEELATSAEIPEDDIDTSVDIFKPVVVAPNPHSTNQIPKKKANYNPETGERIDNSVEIFRPVSKNTVPTIIYNDKLTQDPEGTELLN